MKLRYYMRGLGIGVIVTAILMGISLGGDKEKLTDAEIIARAKALGMVESSVLADLGKEQEMVQNPSSSVEDTSESKNENLNKEESQDVENVDGNSKVDDSTNDDSQIKEDQNEDTKEETSKTDESETETPKEENSKKEDTEEENPKEDETQSSEEENTTEDTQPVEEYVTLVISRGESSVSVSKSLAELGLVESAKAYDKFLCNNGYDKYIKVGTHKIKVGSTDEEIAEIISRKKK